MLHLQTLRIGKVGFGIILTKKNWIKYPQAGIIVPFYV